MEKIVTFQEGYVNPSQTNHKYFDGDVKWLRAVDLNDSEVWDTSRKLSVIGFESAGKSALMFKPNTIAISKSGTIGRLGILKDFMCGNRAVINIEVDENQADLMFVFYSLIMARREIIQYAVGSVQANLYPSVLGKLKIWLPPLSIQRKISSILSSLDEMKIINQNVSTKSEEIISALYRSWFIDFYPVKAKSINNLAYGMNQKTASLFPDSFQDSEMGPIPKGWRVGTLKDIANITMGSSPPGDSYCDFEEGSLPLLNGAADFNGSILTPKQATKQPTRIAKAGDMVFCIRATIGHLSVCKGDYCVGRGVASVRELKEFDRTFLYVTISFLFRIWEWEATGSVIKGITGPEVRGAPILLPPDSVREAFEIKCRDLLNQTQSCIEFGDSLRSARVSLMHKLMSGELKVN